MTDLNDAERVRLAEAANRALEQFLGPAFDIVEADYAEKLIKVAASTDPRAPDVIARLANGLKSAREARAQIDALVADGKWARNDMIRAEKIAGMSAPARRLLNIGQA